jgi:hypothetical protein
MKTGYLKYFLLLLALVIIAVIVFNYTSSKPKRAKQNPYEYNIDEFKKVDPSLIRHKEMRQIRIDIGESGGIACSNGMIWLAANGSVKAITPDGKISADFSVDEGPRAIAVDQHWVLVGYRKYFALYSLTGEKYFQSDVINDSTVITSVALWNDKIVIADAGKRRVYLFTKGIKEKEFEGVSGTKNLHGFVIPSPYFDIAINSANELWVANTGIHSLQQYDNNGNLIRSWEKISLEIEGFSGCCNPAHFTFLPDGRFVTSEKGMPRIKIYTSEGKLESVVAPPDKFRDDGHAPDVATLGDIIVALDYDRKMIRLFTPVVYNSMKMDNNRE